MVTRACPVALLVDFNYDTEPLTGHYPARLGLPLLKESRLIHLGKLAFQQLYWHSLLPGRDHWLRKAGLSNRVKLTYVSAEPSVVRRASTACSSPGRRLTP
jgi:hypothetical protein